MRIKFNSVQFLSPVRLFVTPWTTSHQASLSITNSWSSLTLMTLELVMPSNLLIPCHPLLPPSSFPTSGSFPMSHFFASDGQSFGASILASVLPMNIQGWFRLGLTGLISLLSRVEKAMATHSSTLSWRIPWTEEPGRLQSMGSHRVGQD